MIYRHKSEEKKVSLLGYGAMRMPTLDSGSDIDQTDLNRQVKYMLDHGLTYFDTSPVYCRGESERRLGEALKKSGYAREDYVLATKMSNFSPTLWPLADSTRMFEKSLENLQTDYIDNYLLHAVGMGGMQTFRKRYLDNGALDWCRKQRDKRRIRNLGFSFHGDQSVFDWCLAQHDQYHWDFAMIQMNYVDWLHAKTTNARNTDAKILYEQLTEKKIPVVIMEPLLGGRLARYNWSLANELTPLDPNATLAKWAFRFCGSFNNVMTILSGMSHKSHMEENCETFSSLKPCTAAEFAALERAAVALLNLATIPCNACDYCMPCPYGLNIPAILTFLNQVLASKRKLSPREILARYAEQIPEPLRRADHCTGCGRCEAHCPQIIAIASEIARVDAWITDLKSEAAQ